ncbi:sensor histidine kinase [Falsiroseomonas oryziterrae]|uniref:sensor histidine kinase n=1 Tax=Falsiroseomonas oryziterrae TaxID=2911368 RepID=UPI001F4905A1|nr:HAMP domain-containing sensor histidine kinase [Roseomonas sp. NPKOSM-4]
MTAVPPPEAPRQGVAPEGPRALRLPPALRLPAAAGAVVFAVAVGTTQVAMQVANREADRQLERLGQVYLDGLAASVRLGMEARDPDYIEGRFQRAFSEQRGVAERALFAFATDGELLARYGDAALPDAAARAAPDHGMRLDEAAGIAWLARSVTGEGRVVGRLIAALDIAPMLAARARLSWTIVLVDLVLAALFALVTWLLLGRLGRPLRALVERLSDGAHRPPAKLPDAMLAGADPRTAQVLAAYNRMVDGVRERERLATELAERDQAAALGRLAATIAHEVRNPLGGLATAVSTLRRFGDRPDVRDESLAFLERGIGALDRIVSSTLNVYRPEDDRRLTRSDLEDLRHLIRPAAERSGVALDFELDLPDGDLALGSGGIRQVLLNLLLNACAATPPGGRVGVRVRVEGEEMICEVADEGPGLDPARLGPQGAGTPSRRLGLDVVVGLLGSLDARASVAARPGGGTLIRLAIPMRTGAPE